MRSKLTVVVVVMVILPTAILSLMAARTLSSWGAVLERRLSAGASATLELVATEVDRLLDMEGDRLRGRVADALHGGSRQHQLIAEAIQNSEEDRILIDSAYLFMDPWGFIYPDEGEEWDDPNAAARSLHNTLRAELGHAISAAHSLDVRVRFREDGVAYCFAALPNRKDLYAGFAVNEKEFHKELQRILNSAAGEDFSIRAVGPGIIELVSGRQPKARVEGACTNNVSPPPLLAASDGGYGGTLAVGRLHAPYHDIYLEIIPQDANSVMRTAFIQVRLYGVGIVLLVLGIFFGTVYILWGTSMEIQRARSRSAYVIGVSHDLRTPIAAMKVMAESLHEGRVSDGEKRKMFLQIILNECEHLQELTERVLFFVRYGQQTLIYRRAPTDIGTLVRVTAESFQARHLARQASTRHAKGTRERILSVQVEDTELTADVDESAIRQVLLNLLDNAAKYGVPDTSTDDEQDPPIMLKVDRWTGRTRPWLPRHEWVRIEVRDTGIGMTPVECRRIFREFYRGGGSTQKNLSGVGLGLALCRHVVRGHRGCIRAEAAPGSGTAFIILLPLHREGI